MRARATRSGAGAGARIRAGASSTGGSRAVRRGRRGCRAQQRGRCHRQRGQRHALGDVSRRAATAGRCRRCRRRRGRAGQLRGGVRGERLLGLGHISFRGLGLLVELGQVELGQGLSGRDLLAELHRDRCDLAGHREADGGPVDGRDRADRGDGLRDRAPRGGGESIRRSGGVGHGHRDTTANAERDHRGDTRDEDPPAPTASRGPVLTHRCCSMLRRLARGRSRPCSRSRRPG